MRSLHAAGVSSPGAPRSRTVLPAALLAAAAVSAALLATALPPGTASAQDGGGISVEEYLRVFPPAPVDVRAAVEDGAVVVTWSPPAAVAARADLAYDAAIAGYRIHRIDGSRQALVGEVGAETLRFRDPAAGTGVRHYAVTAVQRSGQESGLSHTAEVRHP